MTSRRQPALRSLQQVDRPLTGFREFAHNGRVIVLQQIQCSTDHLVLVGRIVGTAKCGAVGEGDGQRSRCLDSGSVLLDQGDNRGAESSILEDPSNHTDCVRAKGSSGCEDYPIHALGQQALGNFRRTIG